MPTTDVVMVSLYPPQGRRHAGGSGVASYTANLAHALTEAGAAVEVFCARDGGGSETERDGGVIVRRAFRRGPGALPDAVAAAKATDAPVVHVQFELFLYGGALSLMGLVPALAALRRAGRRVVVTLHQVVDPGSVDRQFVRLHHVRSPSVVARNGIASVQAAIRRLADAVIVHEPFFTQHLPGATVIRHGVETLERFDRATARSDLGLGTKPTVLCFGFVAPYKGLESALEAARRTDAFHLVVAGGVHPRLRRRNPKRGYLARLIAEYGDVARFTGYVPESAVARWFSAADVALFPYPHPFSSSGALALALGFGTPVLLSPAMTECTDAPDELRVSLDPTELARDLDDILGDPVRKDAVRLSSEALRAGRSWSETARAHLDLYEEVLHADGIARRRVRAG